MSDVRRISEFLPEVLQTDVLRKFFAATADHMFQPDRVEYLNAYVGQLPSKYDANADATIKEITPERQAYQVEPGLVSRNSQSGNITHMLSYDDLINKLRWHGALVDDHNRLFQGDYYVFGLPVDLDKMVNYTQYVWSAAGPQLIRLQSETNLQQIAQSATYTYSGDYQFVTDNMTIENGELTFTTGLRVQFARDVDVNVRNLIYIVEGVGRQIRLVPDQVRAELAWDQPDAWDSTPWDSAGLNETPAYITIGRGSQNGNPWSRTNRWFHKQTMQASGTPIEPSSTAQRPILEFDHTITLWNFGTHFLMDVNLVDTTRLNLNDVLNQSDVMVDNVRLDDGQIVLFTNLTDDTLNNRLYQVHGVRATGRVSLNQLPVGSAGTGLPDAGAVIFITQGEAPSQTTGNEVFYQNVSMNFYWTGDQWRKGQSRQLLPTWLPGTPEYVAAINQAPLFQLYDHMGERVDNPQKYPGSTFTGCTLLNYRQNAALPVDAVLGFRPDVDASAARNYTFDVSCVQLQVQYQTDGTLQQIPGYYYWQQNFPGGTQYVNNWFASDTPSRQYVVNEYVAATDQVLYDVDQTPAMLVPGAPTITVQVGARHLGVNEYQVQGAQVQLNQAPEPGTVVRVRTWGGLRNHTRTGYFETPINLKANPDNAQVSHFRISDILPHVHSVLINQDLFEGDVAGSNNWRDLAQLPQRGTQIVQHRASLLPVMVLNSVDQSAVFEGSQSITDPLITMQWSQSEYLRYYNKFVNGLWALYNNQALTGADDVTVWIQRVMRQINLGKTRNSAWVNSGVDQRNGAYCSQESVNPTWTPASAARLGAWSVWQPVAFYDDSQPRSPTTGVPPLMMRCHNGALVALSDLQLQPLGEIAGGATSTSDPEQLTHPVARAWLQFELMQFESVPVTYADVDHTPALDVRCIFSGKFRKTSYSRQDLIQLQSASWNRWLTLNQVDALRNTTFDAHDPFTWNYSECMDADGESVPGHWRGIYFYYYDTDQPHVSPWHMLGFTQKPTWWDTEYGAAPYTRGNLKLWQDLAAGRIRSGARAGIHAAWARPGLQSRIPVNDAGELLPPFEAGVVTQLPTMVQAAADWRLGDRAPLEHVWLTSVDADQSWSQWGYLAQPAAFISYLWDGVKQVHVFADQTYDQWVQTDVWQRPQMASYVMHRENPSTITSLNLTATYQGSCGIQQWFSEKLVSDARNVTTFLGDVWRGAGVNLLHKMGGFTDGNNMRVLVDSFGLTNVDNLLLPQEDVTCQLLRSASTQEYVYTGVLVEYVGRNQGWRVIGYDPQDPFFTVIPSRKTGPKQTVVVEKQQVTEYKQGENRTSRVPYGTILATRQEVYDFLISLGRAQEAAGWRFDEYDSTASRPRNWSLSAREFLFWSQGPWAPGTYITLSPAATLAKFRTEFGIIQHIGGLVNGSHSVTDRLGNLISLADLDFLRIDDEISVRVLSDTGIYGLRLYTTSLEHALIFNNHTVFGDTVYDPVLNQRQLRFKLFGYRTLNWRGRLEAPGYLVTQSVTNLGNNLVVNNRIIPNLEKSVNDIRKIFETDLSTPFDANNQTSVISQALPANLLKLAQHQIAYQARPYLTDLLLDNSAEFQFYQGMIKQKGTSSSIDALLRNTQVVKPDQSFSYFEEWAVRSGQYGADADQNQLDVILPQQLMTSNPQLVDLLSDADSDPLSDNQITIVKRDARTVYSSSASLSKFKLREQYGSRNSDLPTAGAVFPEEVTYQVTDLAQLQALYAQVRSVVIVDPDTRMIAPGDRVWQFVDGKRGWNVWKLCACDWQVSVTQPNVRDRTLTTITSTTSHGLQEGDLIVIYGVVNAGVNINDTFEVINVWDDITFDIRVSTTGTGTGGTAWQYVSVRFRSEAERDQARLPGGWQSGDLAWVDGDTQTPWRVFISSGRNWFVTRIEGLKTDLDYVTESRLYDVRSLQTLQQLSLWDPVKNRIPGTIDQEISYKTAYDPAQYTQDPSGVMGVNAPQAWGEAQVGQVWWDLSTTRFLEYEMGSDTQRRQNWGRIAPGTSVDIYEWVRSPVPPTSWQNLVAAGADLTSIGSPGAASGEISNPFTPYVTATQITSTGEPRVIYYFWVRNGTTVPAIKHRKLSSRVISQALTNPENLGIAWWAPIGETQTLIGNVGTYLNGDDTVWQTKWLSKYDVENVHREYEIVSESDPRSSPPSWLWRKLGDSLREYDALNYPLPDTRLKMFETQGVLTRPRQNVFQDIMSARRAVVQTVNSLLQQSDTPPLKDTGRQAWRPFFESEEPVPPARNELTAVRVATTPFVVGDSTSGRLNAYLRLNPKTHVTELLAAAAGPLILDGITCRIGDRVLVKDQQSFTPFASAINRTLGHDPAAENGIYVVVHEGGATPWCLERVAELQQGGEAWTQAQVMVSSGLTQANTVWHQTLTVVNVNQDPVIWQRGPATPIYVDEVMNMAQLNEKAYMLPVGSQVLVAPVPENQNKWTIWRWTSTAPGQAEWQLVRSQTFRTQNCWQETDWYAPTHDETQLPDYVWNTLAERDQFLGYQTGDLVRVLNTGNNTWAQYERVDVPDQPWLLVALQSGSLQLSDNLWDYARFNLGFGAQGFGAEITGAEHDTRREFDMIWQGLWVEAQGTQGLLKVDDEVNEPNQILFVLINQVLTEQKFVDWLFKTSFISLRGFAETLQPTELYTENKINSLISYINEVKPYHVNLRSFVDTRKASESYQGDCTDFDRPPYSDVTQGVRILQDVVPGDQVILSTDDRYSAWYQNHMLHPELVRSIRTRMIYDRVSCHTHVVYESGYSANQIPDIKCSSLSEWLDVILDANVPLNTLVQVHVPGYYLMTRNQDQLTGLQNWIIQPWGLNHEGEISVSLYEISHVLQLLNQPVSVGYTAKVYVDDLQTWNWYVKTENTQDITDWQRVAYQAAAGAAQRIQDAYVPGVNQPTADDPLLISGCASKLTTLSGETFETSDAWDAHVWDSVKGWDYTSQNQTGADVTVNSGGNLKYQLFVGDGARTEFSLVKPPQQPTELQVWVAGRRVHTPQDWVIPNQISQVLLINAGVGYSMNDLLQLTAGQYVSAARFRVTGVSALGAITQLEIVEPGVYDVAPQADVLSVAGGTGVNASVTVRWRGQVLKFTQAPPVPTEPRPNVWVIERGETFNPALTTLLDTTIDGAGLNRPHLEGGHPEELMPVWCRHTLQYDVYTAGTGGAGTQLNQVYVSDGVRTHFELPAPINENQQIWVFVNGELQTWGITADYVINYQYPQVVFVNAPPPGRVNIHQIGWGGATPGVGSIMLSDSGVNYELYDTVTLDAAVPVAVRPRAQITAVKAVGIQIQQGGANYQVGDQLLYKFGAGTQTLIVEVTQIQNVTGDRGVITRVQIVKPGYYTDLSVGIQAWFTTGTGTGAQLSPVWGAAQVFMVDRGALLEQATTFNQITATSSTGAPSLGTGLQLTATPSHIQQQVFLQGDGVNNMITFSESVRQNHVWLTLNGDTTTDWDLDSSDDRTLVLRFVPQPGDVVAASLFKSGTTTTSMFSRKQVQTLQLMLPTLTYDLTPAPGFSVAPSLNTQVFCNGVKLRAPEYRRFQGNGTQTLWNLMMSVVDTSQVKVWINSVLIGSFEYTLPGLNQIQFNDAPASASDILIEITNAAVSAWDYHVSGSQITFQPGVLTPGDQVQVITFTEDSAMKWCQDRFSGVMPATYTLSRMPTDFGSVQVYVDGVKQDAVWDYQFVQVQHQVTIQFNLNVTHAPGNTVDVYYVVHETARPPVAFRMFENLFGDVKYYRLSDRHRTQLSDTLLWDSEHIWVRDGAPLPAASLTQPGVIWLGAERVEYTQIVPDPTTDQPHRHRLTGLRRGSMGTPTGVFSDVHVEFHNGDGVTQLFRTDLSNPIVKVNNQEQLVGVHYDVVLNPLGVVPGIYVNFKSDHIPAPGDRNIQFVRVQNSVISDQVSHVSGSWAQDASLNQEIPAGYIWPHGAQGIQRSAEPQTEFLIAEPGTRIR
jgi:hypothetical protein